MNCTEIREYLFAFLDNELDAHLSIELQHHLDHCPACAQQAEIEREGRRCDLRIAFTTAANSPEDRPKTLIPVIAVRFPKSSWPAFPGRALNARGYFSGRPTGK